MATGAIGGQQFVSGFEGIGLIDTFLNGSDQAQGTLTSPIFTISKPYINFLIGGGDHPYPGNNDATAVLLLVNGQVVRSATGQDDELLNWVAWNVSQFVGQQAQIEIVDENSSGWGHINADQFLAADSPALPLTTETTVDLLVDGKVVRSATGQNSPYLQWVSWNVADFSGETRRSRSSIRTPARRAGATSMWTALSFPMLPRSRRTGSTGVETFTPSTPGTIYPTIRGAGSAG